MLATAPGTPQTLNHALLNELKTMFGSPSSGVQRCGDAIRGEGKSIWEPGLPRLDPQTLWILRMGQSLETAERGARKANGAIMEEYALHSEGARAQEDPWKQGCFGLPQG